MSSFASTVPGSLAQRVLTCLPFVECALRCGTEEALASFHRFDTEAQLAEVYGIAANLCGIKGNYLTICSFLSAPSVARKAVIKAGLLRDCVTRIVASTDVLFRRGIGLMNIVCAVDCT